MLKRREMIGILEQNRKWLFARLIANGAAQAIAALAMSRIMHLAFDRVRHSAVSLTWATLAQLAAGLGGMALLIAWFRMTERIDAEKMGQDYVKQLRNQLFEYISATPPRYFQRRSRGSMMLRFIGDLRVLRQWISLGLARVIVAAVSICIAMAGLAWMNPWVAVGPSVVIVLGCLIGFAWGNHLLQAVSEARRRQSNFAANVNEKISSIAVVQAFGQLDRERMRIADQGEKLKEAMVVQARAAAQLRAIGDGSASLASASVLLTGALEVQAGKATAGTVIAAMSMVGLITPVLRDLSSSFVLWQGARVSRRKIEEFIESSPVIVETPDAPDLLPGPGSLEFRNLSLDSSLREVSAYAPPGSRIVLIGPNGSGKSTLLSLAARMVDPDQGQILLDNQDLAKHSLASLRRRMGIVSPDLPLLRGSVAKNLRYRWPEAPEEEVARVISLCGLEEVIQELPKGLKTRVTEGGASLSLGQRQRVGLARAVLGSPSVLLLDEADANLDPKSGWVLEQVMANYRGTVLLISHNYEFVRTADLVWYMEGGRLVEAGPPEKVLNGSSAASRFFGDSGRAPAPRMLSTREITSAGMP